MPHKNNDRRGRNAPAASMEGVERVDELIKIAEQRLADLEAGFQQMVAQHEKLKADIHAQEGAIQDCKFWIETIKSKGG
jgi:hypothetical protein